MEGFNAHPSNTNSLKETLRVKKTTVLILLMLGVWVSDPVTAQDSKVPEPELTLTLEEALAKASQDGYEVQISKREMEVAKAEFMQSNTAFLPQLTIEESAIRTNDPIGVFGIKLRQGVITTADFDPVTLNDPEADHNFTTSLSIQQPVFNPDALLQRSAAKFMFRSSEFQHKAVEEYSRLKVKEIYFQLAILDEQIKVIQKHLETVKEFEKQANDYHQEGIINKADHLSARVQVLHAEKDLLASENARQTLNEQFLIMLGINGDQKINIADPLEIATIRDYSAVVNSRENSTLLAYSNQVKASEKMLRSSRFTFLPKLNVFGMYELHDSGIFGTQADNYTIGASLRWELFKGMQNVGKVSKSKAELRKAELVYEQKQVQHESDIRKAKRSIGEAIRVIELSETTLEQSQEDVRIRSDRYEQGLEKTSDLLLAEAKHLKTELEGLQARYQYYMSVAQLEYLLETDL